MEKIGIIDLGSNTARLVLVNVLDSGNFMVFDELKENVRLGQDMKDGILQRHRIDQTIKTLKMFKRLCDANGVTNIIAFTTSAVRKAKNQKGFLNEVLTLVGIDMKVLSREEECILAYEGVINSMDISKGLIMDIGGGSTQLIYYNRRNIIASEVIPFGAVSLLDKFKEENLTPEERSRKIEELFAEYLSSYAWMSEMDPETRFIGVGGNFRNLGKISRIVSRYPFDMAHNYCFPTTQFNTIYDTLKGLDIDKTSKIKGLSRGRADIFPVALSAIKAVVDHCSFQNITISTSGIREGTMFRYAVPTTQEKPISDVLGFSIYGLLRFYKMNIPHAEQVYSLSLQLFKQLKVLHKLPRIYAKILKTASLLHDTGTSIKYYQHEKHSSYIILNSSLYGISHKDIIMAAFIAAAQKTGDPFIPEFDRYKSMFTLEELDAIFKLGVILKIAESFDRSEGALIKNITCDVLGASVILQTETVEGADISLEIQDAMMCSGEFLKAFKKTLVIL